MAACYGVWGIISWVGINLGYLDLPSSIDDPVLWHAHEMIYGFVIAVVAGFLLTAVANWTGGAPVRKLHLAVLCSLWLLGRIAMHIDGLPLWGIAIADNVFIPALAVSLAVPLWGSRNTRNFIFLGILTVFFACNVTFFVTQERLPLHLAVLMVITMISLVSGRIIPAFTVGGLRRIGLTVNQKDQPLMDKICFLSLIILMTAFFFSGAESVLTGTTGLLSGGIHLWRYRHYHASKAIKEPMLWILHAGYLWLSIGLILLGLSALGFVSLTIALHALTTGCIGSMCIGMMCRVTLGHSGRNIIAKPITQFMFLLMQLAVLLRTLGPVLYAEGYIIWIVASGVIWALCFAIYVPAYFSMLLKARPDGLPA